MTAKHNKLALNSHGALIWFTGLPCSGKTTLSCILAATLRSAGVKVEILDGDEVRENLSKDLGFTRQDRDTHVRRLGFVGNLLARNGVYAIVAAISPYRAIRDEVRVMSAAHGVHFVEVFVNCPLAVAEARDVKGMYLKARKGEIRNFTGISDPYEEPLAAEVVVDTAKESSEKSVAQILQFFEGVQTKR